jgi:hypothetical protein
MQAEAVLAAVAALVNRHLNSDPLDRIPKHTLMGAEDLRIITGMPRPTFYRHLSRWIVEGRVEKRGHGVYVVLQ